MIFYKARAQRSGKASSRSDENCRSFCQDPQLDQDANSRRGTGEGDAEFGDAHLRKELQNIQRKNRVKERDLN